MFHSSHLSVKHYLEQVFDFFAHFENKVLRSVWLNFIKPGFITKENLRGVTVPYAKPVQLFVLVNLVFYFTMNFLSVSDYTPLQGDQNYFGLSSYLPFKWTEPFDESVINYIDSTGERKRRVMAEVRTHSAMARKDSFNLKFDSSGNRMLDYELNTRFNNNYYEKVTEYSKLLVIILVPFIALIFYLLFYKKLQSYGAALILATHFMAYNLLIFSIESIINYIPERITGNPNLHALPARLIDFLFYNKHVSGFVWFIFGDPFEMLHFILWLPWLFIAFKRLFNPNWFINLLACYFSVRIFYYLIFGLY